MVKNYLKSLIEKSYDKNSKHILSLLEEKEGAKLLDLGCNDGSWTIKLGEKLKGKVYGVDVVEGRLSKAKKRGVEVKKSDLNKKLPFEDNYFDVVHANQVIEHLHSTDDFVSEIYRVLAPGGYALISSENLSSWHNIFALVLGFQPFSMSNVSVKGSIGNPFALWKGAESENSSIESWQHNRLFSYFGLKDLFTKFGFSVEKTLTSGYYPLPLDLSFLDKFHGHWITIKVRKSYEKP